MLNTSWIHPFNWIISSIWLIVVSVILSLVLSSLHTLMLWSYFNNHVTFYLSYLGMNYSNVIGYLLIQIFILQFISGLLLSGYYSPFYTIAFDSVFYIMIDVKYGWLIRFYHVIGSSLFMFLITAHWIRGSWLRLKIFDLFYSLLIWLSGILLLIFSMIEGFLGYILNWGQMSYWGINVIINIISSFWIFDIISLSWIISLFLFASLYIIINHIFTIHFIIGVILSYLLLIHILLLHSFSSFNALFNSYSSLIIPFFPLFYNDIFVTFICCYTSFCYFIFYEPEILGNSDNLIFANVISTPNHILPEWYFLIYYSCLRAFSNKNIGILIVLFLLTGSWHLVLFWY